jgi:hypothetical protein
VRKAVGVRVVETLEEDQVPSHKQGQTLKHAIPNLDDLDIGEYLTEEELHLIASEGIEVMNDLSPGAEFDYKKFGRYQNAWEEKNRGASVTLLRLRVLRTVDICEVNS